MVTAYIYMYVDQDELIFAIITVFIQATVTLTPQNSLCSPVYLMFLQCDSARECLFHENV